MRDIKFRGKAVTGVWVYGGISIKSHGTFINDENLPYDDCCKVIPETVGQYTGLKDKNKAEVYESDYAKNYAGKIGLIKFGSFVSEECNCEDPRYYGWYLEYFDGKCLPLDDNTEQWLTVISNIHDNPELLKGGTSNRQRSIQTIRTREK